jgi:hypothetical protein
MRRLEVNVMIRQELIKDIRPDAVFSGVQFKTDWN